MPLELTEDEKEAVRNWLKMGNHDICPFTPHTCHLGFYNQPPTHPICLSWFPKIEEKDTCPCFAYSMDHVIRLAREMIEEGRHESNQKKRWNSDL